MNFELVKQFQAAHPFYFAIASFAAGAFMPKLVDFAMTNGIDFVVTKGLKLQKLYLVKFGVSPDRIKAIEAQEAIALARAAEDVKKDAEAPEQPTTQAD